MWFSFPMVHIFDIEKICYKSDGYSNDAYEFFSVEGEHGEVELKNYIMYIQFSL